MRDLSELNINEGGRSILRPPPSEELIKEFEGFFGVTLPAAFKVFLTFANGGHPELNLVGETDNQFAVNRFYHLTSSDRGMESLWYAIAQWRPILGDKVIPFAEDGGGSQFFLDLTDSPPSVKLCLHDEGMRVIPIASSFDAFVDGLSLDLDMI